MRKKLDRSANKLHITTIDTGAANLGFEVWVGEVPPTSEGVLIKNSYRDLCNSDCPVQMEHSMTFCFVLF